MASQIAFDRNNYRINGRPLARWRGDGLPAGVSRDNSRAYFEQFVKVERF